MGGGCEVESDAAGLEAHEKDRDLGVVGECVDHSVSSLHAHAALQTHAPDPNLRKEVHFVVFYSDALREGL